MQQKLQSHSPVECHQVILSFSSNKYWIFLVQQRFSRLGNIGLVYGGHFILKIRRLRNLKSENKEYKLNLYSLLLLPECWQLGLYHKDRRLEESCLENLTLPKKKELRDADIGGFSVKGSGSHTTVRFVISGFHPRVWSFMSCFSSHN